jgi:hypothetical protein
LQAMRELQAFLEDQAFWGNHGVEECMQ